MKTRDVEIKKWAGEGVVVEVDNPSPARLSFLARMPEFDLVAEGNTLEQAINNLLQRLDAFIETSLESDRPLPSRAGKLDVSEEPTGDNG